LRRIWALNLRLTGLLDGTQAAGGTGLHGSGLYIRLEWDR
jgi:hypothetical protein